MWIPQENESDRKRRAVQKWERGGILRSLNGDPDPWRSYLADDGYSRSTEPAEDSRLRQDRAPQQKFTTDQKIGGVHPGESQPDSDEAVTRRRMQAPSDFDPLENPEEWNRTRKL